MHCDGPCGTLKSVDSQQRLGLANEALDGYANGPDAPIQATATAMAKAESARSVVLVEGISDQMALETLASVDGRDLEDEGIVIVPIGGAQAASRYLLQFGPRGRDVCLAGLCDVGEESFFRRGLAAAGLCSPAKRTGMEELGFFACVKDLEDELIRASGRSGIETVLDSQGDLGSFRTLQKQSQWRDQPFDAQMHRWLRAGARRNLRYARLLVLSIPRHQIPRPLAAVLLAAS